MKKDGEYFVIENTKDFQDFVIFTVRNYIVDNGEDIQIKGQVQGEVRLSFQ